MSKKKYNTRIVFLELAENDGPMPGEEEKQKVYECWAKIDEVWIKDIEIAKANGTLSDITVTIKDPRGNFRPTNKHYLEVKSPYYEGIQYNIKKVMPDLRNKKEVRIVAGVVT